MMVPRPGADDPRGGDEVAAASAPSSAEQPRLPVAAPLRWLGARPDLIMAAAGVLIVGVAVFAPEREPDLRSDAPALEPAGAPRTNLPPALSASAAPLDEAALLAAASEAAGLATSPAVPLTPPSPSAVLAPENDAVFAAGEALRPEPEPAAPERRKSGSVLIFDAGAGDVQESAAPAPDVSLVSSRRTPAAAGPAAAGGNATLTQGTTITAVLESAIDSSRPGSVRALVSSDVRSADGRRVLVPRSSRLVGQYRGDPGSPRAFVVWTRIERPDGSRVPLASVSGQGARFRDSYAASPLVSQVSGADAGGSVRVRPGEPIRVIASRSVDMTAGKR